MVKVRTGVKRHRWTKMTYTPVEVLGVHENGEPAAFPVSEPVEGINCFDCAEPLTKENVDLRCER